jgi:type I pantothenate kinase
MDPSTSSFEGTPGPEVDVGFETFTRQEWAALGQRADPGRSLLQVEQVAERAKAIPLDEVVDVYLPLSRLLGLVGESKRGRIDGVGRFLGAVGHPSPFMIGITGSVAVGKSTTARVLKELLEGGPGNPTVDLLSTDSFLYPNRVLDDRGLMDRKGFPESYDRAGLITALAAIRNGRPDVAVPVYSHRSYDIVPDEHQLIGSPDLMIVEGLNVLQMGSEVGPYGQVTASDFLDVSIYVDATEEDIARWFRQRLLGLRDRGAEDPGAFLRWFASLSDEQAVAVADQTWSGINLVNLRENVAPTRLRAHVILVKAGDQQVSRVLVRRP